MLTFRSKILDASYWNTVRPSVHDNPCGPQNKWQLDTHMTYEGFLGLENNNNFYTKKATVC